MPFLAQHKLVTVVDCTLNPKGEYSFAVYAYSKPCYASVIRKIEGRTNLWSIYYYCNPRDYTC